MEPVQEKALRHVMVITVRLSHETILAWLNRFNFREVY